VAGGILKRREDVEDIAQQVFVKAYFSLKRFDQRAALSTWLYKITVNECWDMLRKKKVRPLVYEADLSEEQARQVISSAEKGKEHPNISERLELRQRVDRLLEGLDERDRLMLILKEVEGFSIEEIAEVLDLNANTVKVRSEEHTSELQSQSNLVCRLLLEKKKKKHKKRMTLAPSERWSSGGRMAGGAEVTSCWAGGA